MALEISTGQAREPVGARERLRRCAEPVRDGDERVLGAAHRTAHDFVAQRRGEQYVDERLARGRHSGRVESVPQLEAGLRTVLVHRLDDHVDPATRVDFAHTLLAEPPPARRCELRGREGMQPPEILGGDEVQRAPVQPRDHHRSAFAQSGVDVTAAQTGRPARTARRAPRAFCAWTASRRRATSSGSRAGAPLNCCAVNRAATTGVSFTARRRPRSLR